MGSLTFSCLLLCQLTSLPSLGHICIHDRRGWRQTLLRMSRRTESLTPVHPSVQITGYILMFELEETLTLDQSVLYGLTSCVGHSLARALFWLCTLWRASRMVGISPVLGIGLCPLLFHIVDRWLNPVTLHIPQGNEVTVVVFITLRVAVTEILWWCQPSGWRVCLTWSLRDHWFVVAGNLR